MIRKVNEKLIKRMIDHHYSVEDICQRLRHMPEEIQLVINKHEENIRKNDMGAHKGHILAVLELFKEGCTILQIAKSLGLTIEQVSNIVDDYA